MFRRFGVGRRLGERQDPAARGHPAKGGEHAYEDQLKKEMPPLPRISGGVRW